MIDGTEIGVGITQFFLTQVDDDEVLRKRAELAIGDLNGDPRIESVSDFDSD